MQAVVARARAGWKERAAVLAAALWWGSATAIGFVAVPLLFASLPSAAMAGRVAARLFSAQVWLAVACGVVLLLASRGDPDRPGLGWARGALLFVIGGVLLALLSEFAVAPRILARQDLRLWHGVGTAMYVLQWLCAGVVVWKVTGSQSPSSRT